MSCDVGKVTERLENELCSIKFSTVLINGPGSSSGKALSYGLDGPG